MKSKVQPESRNLSQQPDTGEEVLDSLEAPASLSDSFDREIAQFFAPDSPPIPKGTIVADRYNILEHLGSGGMGSVYRVLHINTGGEFALKLLHDGSPQARRRFLQEARNAAALRHPNIVQVFDFGESEGQAFLTMEFLNGKDLAAELEASGPLPWPRVQKLLRQVLAALQTAHNHPKRIIHRDIKAENLVLTSHEHLKVVDFGISRALEGSGANTQGLLGSPQAIPPEGWRGLALDERADLYALGCCAFHLLAGKPPFQGSPAALAYAHVHEKHPPIERTGFPEGVEEWVARLMEKAPEDRYQTAESALAALQSISSNQTASLRRTQVAKKKHRNPSSQLKWGLPLLAISALIVGLVVPTLTTKELTHQLSRPRKEVFHPCEARTCKEGSQAWCDAEEAHSTCCLEGMILDSQDGICVCAPGGTHQSLALESGCTVGSSSYEQRKGLKDGFSAAQSRFKACVDESGEFSHAQGRLVVELKVGPYGGVREARFGSGSFPDPQVQACILEEIRAIQFSPPTDGWLAVSYPLELRIPGNP